MFFCLSLGDALLTLWGLSINAIREVNPLMNLLIECYPRIFLLLKLGLPVILGMFCWYIRNRDRALVTYALALALGVYTIVCLFHVYWLVRINVG